MIAVIIVIYNENIADIVKKMSDFDYYDYLVIVDNSDCIDYIEMNNKYKSDQNIIYLSKKNNLGLSKAYNIALDYIDREIGFNDNLWIMISDDDTEFSNSYLNNVKNTIQNTDSKIISGIIKDQDGNYLSPTKRHKNIFKTEYVKNCGKYSNIDLINSGCVIKSTIFNSLRYDEDLFLDMVDYKFMYDLSKNYFDDIEIVGGKIIQNFSGTQKSSLRAKKNRFNMYKKDYITYANKTGINKLVARIFLIKKYVFIYIKQFLVKK